MAYCPLLFRFFQGFFVVLSEFHWILGDFFLNGMTELHLFLLPTERFFLQEGRTILCNILSSEELPCSLQILRYQTEPSLDGEGEEAVAALLLLFPCWQR